MNVCRAWVPAWIVVLGMGNAQADDAMPNNADRDRSAETGYFERLGPSHRWLSEGLGGLSRRLDGYFGSEDIHEEVSGSHAEIVIAPRLADEGESELDADFRLKLDLPRTERRLQFLLESDSDQREADDGRLDRGPKDPSRDAGESDNNIFAGLRSILVGLLCIRLSQSSR